MCSVSSTQKDTVVEALSSRYRSRTQNPAGFPHLSQTRTYHHVVGMDECSGNIKLFPVQNQHPRFGELVLEKLYLKVTLALANTLAITLF